MMKPVFLSIIGLLWVTCLVTTSSYDDGPVRNGLTVGYYRYSCPEAESIVRKTVSEAVTADLNFAAALIRLHFHDCFVRGCDGSILIDSTPGNIAEKDNNPTSTTLHGYEIIDVAKQAIESKCPQVVSCADILAFAARDSANKAGKFNWQVPAGRRDGRISKQEECRDIPPPVFNVQQLTDAFAKKGLSQEDMVTLSGAHSIGFSHCSSFLERLYKFNNTVGLQDPSLDPQLAHQLKLKCPQGNSSDGVVALEPITPMTLDNNYYTQILRNRGLLASDQTLLTNPWTSNMVNIDAKYPLIWYNKFGEAMMRMGAIEVLTGSEGEIRKNCRVVL